jgi:hypothetical protein
MRHRPHALTAISDPISTFRASFLTQNSSRLCAPMELSSLKN